MPKVVKKIKNLLYFYVDARVHFFSPIFYISKTGHLYAKESARWLCTKVFSFLPSLLYFLLSPLKSYVLLKVNFDAKFMLCLIKSSLHYLTPFTPSFSSQKLNINASLINKRMNETLWLGHFRRAPWLKGSDKNDTYLR